MKVAVATTNLALQDERISEVDKNAAIIIGTALPNMPEMTRTYSAGSTGRQFHPLTITHSILNAVSAWISIVLGTHGTKPDAPDSIRRALDHVFAKHKVDYYNAHRTGTRLNDEIECKLLFEESVFGIDFDYTISVN